MADRIGRRKFLAGAAALLGASAIEAKDAKKAATVARAPEAATAAATTPVAVGSGNALKPLEKAVEMVRAGARPIDAVVEGVAMVEDDPADHSVGIGGIPNEEGVVELDASCMDGETMRAGAVAALHNIQNPSRVAKLVLERTNRVLLVGEGALKFARAHGIPEVNLLTEDSRKIWLFWKEKLNERDDWMVGADEMKDPVVARFYEQHRGAFWPQGTIHVSLAAPGGKLAGCTSTSGLYFKIPGRVGDSPIIGAGLYVDGEVGSAGSTGWGEGNLQTLGSHNVVEFMRAGHAPEQACLKACERVVTQLLGKRKDAPDASSRWNVTYYAVNRAGLTGVASIWKGGRYAVHDGTKAELREAAYLLGK